MAKRPSIKLSRVIKEVDRDIFKELGIDLRSKLAKSFPYSCKWQPFNNGVAIDGIEIDSDLYKDCDEDIYMVAALTLLAIRDYNDEDIVDLIVKNNIRVDDVVLCAIKNDIFLKFITFVGTVTGIIYQDFEKELCESNYISNGIAAVIIMGCLLWCEKNKLYDNIGIFKDVVQFRLSNREYENILSFLYGDKKKLKITNSMFAFIMFYSLFGEACIYKDILKKLEKNEEYSNAYRENLNSIMIFLLSKCMNKKSVEINKLTKKLENSTASLKDARDTIDRLNRSTKVVTKIDKSAELEVNRLKEQVSLLSSELEESYLRNFHLMLKVERQDMLLSSYKESNAFEYEKKEESVEKEIEAINLSNYKVCLICVDEIRDQFEFDVYDYIRAPRRIDLLFKYDLVVILTSCNSHKNTREVVDFCRRNGIEFMYSGVSNNKRLVEEIQLYIRYKGM